MQVSESPGAQASGIPGGELGGSGGAGVASAGGETATPLVASLAGGGGDPAQPARIEVRREGRRAGRSIAADWSRRGARPPPPAPGQIRGRNRASTCSFKSPGRTPFVLRGARGKPCPRHLRAC